MEGIQRDLAQIAMAVDLLRREGHLTEDGEFWCKAIDGAIEHICEMVKSMQRALLDDLSREP